MEGQMETVAMYLSAALAVAVPALATAWAQSRIGPAAAATLAEKPEMSVTVVLLIAIPETVAILGFVVAVLLVMQGGG
jgi:V/A-type H+-transporting ATPase subunit K